MYYLAIYDLYTFEIFYRGCLKSIESVWTLFYWILKQEQDSSVAINLRYEED